MTSCFGKGASPYNLHPVKIDAHQHFWHYEPAKHRWITPKMGKIQRNFLPEHLKPLLDSNGIDGCIAVQAEQNSAETQWLLQLATENGFIQGIVGWTDLLSPNLESVLENLKQAPKLKGFRHILQAEHPDFIIQPAFIHALQLLAIHHFTYDILVYPKHLRAVKKLLRSCPDTKFTLDHLAKPYIKHKKIKQWEKDIKHLAAFPNLTCKLSGIITEADWNAWKPTDLKPYIEVAIHYFSPNRLLYGSDWPVCLLATNYTEQLSVVANLISSLSADEQNRIMGENARSFYHL
jgi:L-fuconolactonase